jgi:16S rRNA (cytidine1402-2'-O)-methyltransferase
MQKGKLYLLPTPLHETAIATIPDYVIQQIHQLDVFIAERARTARHFIKATKTPKPIQTLTILELTKHTPQQEWQHFLQAAEEGRDVGLMSEAGCPGVADPGAQIVQLAHAKAIEVIPMVGPSSILLALMASGMNGQHFCFHGYLSVKKPQLIQDLKRLEQLALRHQQTQIFIETPYRNNGLLEMVLEHLLPETYFCIACNLTAPDSLVTSKKIREWKKTILPNLDKLPTVFLIGY